MSIKIVLEQSFRGLGQRGRVKLIAWAVMQHRSAMSAATTVTLVDVEGVVRGAARKMADGSVRYIEGTPGRIVTEVASCACDHDLPC